MIFVLYDVVRSDRAVGVRANLWEVEASERNERRDVILYGSESADWRLMAADKMFIAHSVPIADEGAVWPALDRILAP